jgi:hypothetical protein
MNNLRTKQIRLSPTSGRKEPQETEKLYFIKKASKRVGNRQEDVNQDNANTLSILFFEELGCTIELCQENFSFSGEARSGDGSPMMTQNTQASFENQDDPFYEPDCGKKKPKQNKKREEDTQQQADLVFDLLVDISEETESVTETQTQEVLQSVQQEGSFSASAGIGATGLSTTDVAGNALEDATRNTTSTSGASKGSYFKLVG